jgi:TetR/AcrR family transcriptional repressor of nem operon
VRVSKEKLEEHHDAVLRAASRLFREHGFDNVTVAEVMSAAGLTHGGFYGHFASKAELAGAACHLAFVDRLNACDPSRGLSDYLNRYLSVAHRDDVAGGCPMPSFAGDIRRQDKSVQRSFAEGVSGFVQKLAEMIGKDATSRRQARALAANIVADMVGAVVLARSVAAVDRGLSQELLTSSRLGLKAMYGY